MKTAMICKMACKIEDGDIEEGNCEADGSEIFQEFKVLLQAESEASKASIKELKERLTFFDLLDDEGNVKMFDEGNIYTNTKFVTKLIFFTLRCTNGRNASVSEHNHFLMCRGVRPRV